VGNRRGAKRDKDRENYPSQKSWLPMTRKPLVVELFAGICGASLAFEESGFDIGLLADWDESARKAFLYNYPKLEDRYHSIDIRKISAPEVRRRCGADIAGVLGCPPCQGLSDVGPRKHVDRRNHLLDEFTRLVKGIQPAFFVMENVPRILDYGRFQRAMALLAGRYNIWAGVLNGALYGLPQTRQRVIAIGYSRDFGIAPLPPPPTHGWIRPVYAYDLLRILQPDHKLSSSILGRYRGAMGSRSKAPQRFSRAVLPLVTCADALSDLPVPNGRGLNSYRHSATTSYQKWARFGTAGVINHEAWNHTQNLLRRMKRIGPGESLLSRYGREDHEYYSQAYGRLHRHGLARTITTNFHNPGSGRFLHYAQNRSLTVREAARLQGIPDRFAFPDDIPLTLQERIVGNTFPFIWAQTIARQVAKQIGKLL
jgi:DNA (cytosine-5)-methyltransferase 1